MRADLVVNKAVHDSINALHTEAVFKLSTLEGQ